MGTTSRGKEERQSGSVVWKRGVPQMVLEKHGMLGDQPSSGNDTMWIG